MVSGRRIPIMSIDELEAEALKLGTCRAGATCREAAGKPRGASDEENARLWADEAQRRDEAWEASGDAGHPAAEVFREARARLK
jgi:hypothetical protein